MAPQLKIGLTGGIAAGKSTALAAFERLGVEAISSDAIVHELLDAEPLRSALVERWGAEVAPNGIVDRTRIGEIVFARPGELKWLESQIHPLVRDRIAEWLEALPDHTEFAVVEVPLLFESGLDRAFDVTVAVITTEQVRAERAAARGQALIDERAALQLSQEEKGRRADHLVRNDGTVEELESALAILLGDLRSSRTL